MKYLHFLLFYYKLHFYNYLLEKNIYDKNGDSLRFNTKLNNFKIFF